MSVATFFFNRLEQNMAFIFIVGADVIARDVISKYYLKCTNLFCRQSFLILISGDEVSPKINFFILKENKKTIR